MDGKDGAAMAGSGKTAFYKMEIFIPETHFRALQEVLRDEDAGHIGRYDCCLSRSQVTGSWRPLPGTDPYLGKEGEIAEEPELKVEVTVRADQLRSVTEAVLGIHPYEEPVINIIALAGTAFSLPEDV